MAQWYQKPALGTPLITGHPHRRGLGGWWPFLHNAGEIVADMSGFANRSGVLVNHSFPSTNAEGWSSGQFGTAFAFDGDIESAPSSARHRIDLATTADFNFGATDDLSVMVWVRLDGIQPENFAGDTFAYILGKGGLSSANPGFDILAFNELASVQVIDVADNSAIILTGPILTDGWHFIALTVNRSTQLLSLYVDGILIDTTSTAAVGSLSNADQKVTMGQRHDPNAGVGSKYKWALDGSVDDPRIYESCKLQSEIQDIMHEPFAAFDDPLDVALLAQIAPGFVPQAIGPY